jgi:Tfp pilus assembly protein PilO
MLKKITEIFPAQSIVIFLVCCFGIVGFIFLLILPRQDLAAELDDNIVELEKRIGEQRTLTPVFYSLLDKAKNKEQAKLPITKKAKLARGDMNKVFNQIQAIAKGYNLKLEEITPDVNSLKETSGYLLVRLTVTGDFFKFREFLVELGAIPPMVHIQEIKIRSIEEAREIKLKFWLAKE